MDLEKRVSVLLSMRAHAGIKEAPFIIWEPGPLFCKPENLSACLKAARMVDVFSPNHLELLALCDKAPEPAFEKSGVEVLAKKFLESGVGSDSEGTVIVRAAEHGSVVMSRGIPPNWIPPYYEPGPGAQSNAKVVDPTGAGNAFLGAFAIGYLKTGNIPEAACYGTVGASFALEQVGIPKKSTNGPRDLWNDVDVASRLNEFISRIDLVTSSLENK